MKLYHGKKIMEWRRWFISPVFIIIVILCGTVTLLDVCSSENFVADLKTGYTDSVTYYYLLNVGFFSIVGYCLAACTGAVLYAADYEENSVYMRINRMGVNRYVFSKIIQTLTGAFVCGFIAILFCFFGVSIVYGHRCFQNRQNQFPELQTIYYFLQVETRNIFLHWQLYQVCVMRFIHL